MTFRVRSERLVARLSVVVRKEGGSLSLTVPRHVVRKWRLKAGDRLMVRTTDEGILLYPRHPLPVVRGPEV